jgi:predicted amidohydrolase YtcJ
MSQSEDFLWSRRVFLFGASSFAATLGLGSWALASSRQGAQSSLVAQAGGPADAVYLNGTILTINDDQPTAEAVAVKDGRILAVGDRSTIETLQGSSTQVIDLQGKTMLPGFVDSHGHAYMIGLQATTANLLPPPDGTGKDIPALQMLLTDWAANNPAAVEKVGWIAGFGYDDSQLAEQRHPTRQDLDQVSEDLPVVIIHQSGHLGVANSKALELAGITADTPDPEGGAFRREDGSQVPSGVAEEYAFFQLLATLAARFDDAINDTLVEEGTQFLASFGYTTGQEGRSTGPAIAAMQRVANSGNLAIDLVTYPDILGVQDIQPSRTYENRFRIGGAKLTIDGSPQGKTAWLSEPYFIPPPGQPEDYRGYAAIDEQTTAAAVEKAFANGWQLLCHANGDAASDAYIAALRKAKAKYPDLDNRPVLIHGQVLREDQVDAYQELGVFPSLFPMHTFYWGDYHRDSVLGPKRSNNISPTGWVLDRGMMFGTHHDAPVANPDSMRVLSATVTRRSRTNDIIGPEHRVPVGTALKAMTIWPAWQHFEEDNKGSIEVGKLADFVILSDNPMTIAEDQIADIKVLETIKEGVSIYQRPANAASAPSTAMFGITLNDFEAEEHSHDEESIYAVYGDGCFNHGLGLLVNAVQQQI